MKLIKTLTEKEVFGNYIAKSRPKNNDYKLREAARAIVLDDKNKIAFLNVGHEFHKIPGGGVKKGESLEKALHREMYEETGCTVKIIKELGKIIEYKDKFGEKHISYCYVVQKIKKLSSPKFTKQETKDGYKLSWIKIEDAIKISKKDKPKDYFPAFMSKRDLFFMNYFKKKIKNNIIKKPNL